MASLYSGANADSEDQTQQAHECYYKRMHGEYHAECKALLCLAVLLISDVIEHGWKVHKVWISLKYLIPVSYEQKHDCKNAREY